MTANRDNRAAYTAVPGLMFSQILREALKRAEAQMFVNISPKMHKILGDGSEIIPLLGSVIAAKYSRDPDYFFNWIRDSANVMKAVVDLYEQETDNIKANGYLRAIDHYLDFTERLQNANTPYGLGETRFNVDATVDTTEWSRPQYDGPALRALTLMRFLEVARIKEETNHVPYQSSRREHIRKIIERDLDFLVDHWHQPCFDIWESYEGAYYATRLFALSAFERASGFCASWQDDVRAATYKAVADAIRAHLELFWRQKEGIIAYSMGALKDIHGEPRTAPGQGFDAGVVMASVEANVPDGPHSLTDPRLMSTAAKIEDIFASLYPINSDPSHGAGTAIGRHIGDGYYGGHPWFFITAGFAELHYKLAAALAHQPALTVTKENQEFLNLVAKRMSIKPWAVGEDIMATTAGRKSLICGLRQRGDDFLWMIMYVVPTFLDGGQEFEMAEQFDKETGEPRSATFLTWSYSSFITAGLARAAAVAAESSL